jgi:catechol 2,3-dioxygenase-like lactoylglutathione lyase family enzyme
MASKSKEHLLDWTLEVVILPVSDIDRSVAFYRDQVGFELDHDTRNEHMHVVQFTPRGWGCSIVFGDLPAQRQMEPGSMRALQLCVADAHGAHPPRSQTGVNPRATESTADSLAELPYHPHIQHARPSRDHLDLPARHRQLGDHRHRPLTTRARDFSVGWANRR